MLANHARTGSPISLDVVAHRESFKLVAEREPLVARRSYTVLFQRYPEVQPLFGRHSQDEQARMLTQMLASVLDHSDAYGAITQLMMGGYER